MNQHRYVDRRRFLQGSLAGAGVLGLAGGRVLLAQNDAPLRQQALDAAKRAATYFHAKVAKHGGHVYYYSLDLQMRLGEGAAGPEEIWVQPPGTPSVGLALLTAHEATKDALFLDAARDAGAALIYGQLQSGGWAASIDFDPKGPRAGQYRGSGARRGRNNSTLDDGTTQEAIRFLAQLDQALEFKDEKVHGATQVALDALLAAQFANGAFPQVWTGPVAKQTVIKASYPDYDWRTEGRVKNYWDMYTLNDGAAGSVTRMLLELHAIYKDAKYKEAVARLGDFLILAQMPDPQPAWAQQYSYEMHPIWARKFEPASITGGESQDVLETLITIYRATGEAKYLEPIPRAVAYLKSSLLADGRLARFYEMKTNKPLYLTRDEYLVTYDDGNLPTHYAFKVGSRLARIEREYASVKETASSGRREGEAPAEPRRPSDDEVRRIIAALDDQGRWISTPGRDRMVGQPRFGPNEPFVASAVFSQNLTALARYLR